MEIRLAKTAGFCFGVNRAVELTYNLLDGGHKVATLGPLIHNPQAVADMERRGALVADTVDDIPAGPCIMATGPLTEGVLARRIDELFGGEPMHFYDAAAPRETTERPTARKRRRGRRGRLSRMPRRPPSVRATSVRRRSARKSRLRVRDRKKDQRDCRACRPARRAYRDRP